MEKEGMMNFSEFARKKLLRRDIQFWVVNFSEYRLLTEELIILGREINLIAKCSTQLNEISQSDLTELGQLVLKLSDKTNQQIQEMKNQMRKKIGKHSKNREYKTLASR